MNILQILPSLGIGGVETGAVDLARYLSGHGHKAIVVSGGGKLVKELEAANCRHYKLPVGRKSAFSIIRMVYALGDIIRREDIDIVHARSRVPAIIAYFACKMTGRTFITTAHGYYGKHLFSDAMGWGKYVIVASNIMAKHMVHDFGVPHSRIRLIPRGVDLDRFTYEPYIRSEAEEFVVGIVSRITPLKGHADFIKAVAILNRKIPKLKAIIVGSAPKDKYREDVELLSRRLGLSRTIEFAGARHDIPEMLKKMDVLICATTTPEAFGRSIIEAQASGVPVVSTAVGGVVDIIEDRKTGLLCASEDPRDMADKVMELYNGQALCSSLASEARRKVEASYNLGLMIKRTLAVYEEALKVKNILVIKISAIGDVILSVPSLKAIRGKFPEANIKVLVGVRAREVLDRCPYINDRIVCDFGGKHKGFRGLWRLSRELGPECFDIVIDLQNNRSSHLLAFLSMAHDRYGYDNGKLSFLLNRGIRDDAPYLDPLEHQFRVLKVAGIKPHEKTLELWPSSLDDDNAGKLLADNWVKPSQPIVGVNVRASERWFTKNWPAAHIAELCDRLAKDYGARVVLTGTSGDAEYAEHISRLSKSKPIIAAGKTTVLELASLIKRFRVYLTPDSAPMHIASSMRSPFIALFGPTDPARHLAPSNECMVICKAADFDCSPCYGPTCKKKITCMKKITVDEVISSMKSFIEKGAN